MKYQVKDYYVKEIADYYGISAQTVRLYDKKGLLPSDKNELNGYRIYTREDIVTMDYICRLKKMHFSLEDIRKIMNEEPLEEAERMFVKQEAKLAAEVEELQRLIGNMRDYRAKLDRVIAHEKHRARGESAKIEIVNSPPFIIKEIDTNMDEAMESFAKLDSDLLPLLTVESGMEDTLNYVQQEKAGDFFRNIENRKMGDYKLSLIDEKNLRNSPAFDFETFRVIEPTLALYTVLRIATNKDYACVDEFFAYLRDNDYEISGSALARTIANCYCDSESTEYVELWIPVTKREQR